ncbi:MAG: hypothetical protein QW566_04340 [Candidatus Jordarchaeales archaeon]
MTAVSLASVAQRTVLLAEDREKLRVLIAVERERFPGLNEHFPSTLFKSGS